MIDHLKSFILGAMLIALFLIGLVAFWGAYVWLNDNPRVVDAFAEAAVAVMIGFVALVGSFVVGDEIRHGKQRKAEAEARLTERENRASSIDDVALEPGDRILIKDQPDGSPDRVITIPED